ncbi:MAG: dihydrofolate reductase family protein [SAR324 cluster bacterium]|nr:dihydrofolate reductase family protein [SAR324 cluster bacterium]
MAGSPQFRVYIAATVDGYIADAQGSVAFLDAFEGENHGYKEFFRTIDTLVMGRRSFDQVLGFGNWPYEKKRTVVLSNREGDTAAAPNLEFAKGDIGSLADRLAAQAQGDVWLMGGADVIRQFLAARRVHSIEIFVMPLLLGSGVRLFPEPGATADLALTEQQSYPSGVQRLFYAFQRTI